MASDTRVRLDIGFHGGSVLTVLVDPQDAGSLEERLRRGEKGALGLDTEDGRLLVVLDHLLYVRRHSRGGRVGFGPG